MIEIISSIIFEGCYTGKRLFTALLATLIFRFNSNYKMIQSHFYRNSGIKLTLDFPQVDVVFVGYTAGVRIEGYLPCHRV